MQSIKPLSLKNRANIEHIYSVGPSGCGKSHNLMKTALRVRLAGYPVFVCTQKADPILKKRHAPGWVHPDVKAWKAAGVSYVTYKPLYFPELWAAGQIGPCMLVWDEAGEEIGLQPPPLIRKMFRICRDSGMLLCANSQNYKSVAKSVRDNCKSLHLFNVARDDLQSVVNDYRFDLASENTIKRAIDLQRYSHLHVSHRDRIAQIVDRNGREVKPAKEAA